MSCQRCESQRLASVSAKCSDCCGVYVRGERLSGYVPEGLGIGEGDYVSFDWCLQCGAIQGKWPISTDAVDAALREEVDRG